MLANTHKPASMLALALCFAGLSGCASDGGLGEMALMSTMLLPMPPGLDSNMVTGAVALTAGTYIASSMIAAGDSPATPGHPAGYAAQSAPGSAQAPAANAPPKPDLQQLVTRETPERYRPRSCEYIEMALFEVPGYTNSTSPVLKQAGAARKQAAEQVWQEKHCTPATWPRGLLGISMDTIDPRLAAYYSLPTQGVVVLDTSVGSNALKAGLLRDDIITAINQQPITDSIEFRVLTAKAPIGSTVILKVWRSKAFKDIAVVIGMPDSNPGKTGLYCTAFMGTADTYGGVFSPVKFFEKGTVSRSAPLVDYMAKVKQLQPGVWGDLAFTIQTCAATEFACLATGKSPKGKNQVAGDFCYPSQAPAEAQLLELRKGDPTATVIDWP